MKLETATHTLSCVSYQSETPDLEAQTQRLASVETDILPIVKVETDQPVAAEEPEKKRSQSSWAVFGSTFLTIFLAELGDKTQLSTLLMSAESHSPWVVFVGSAAALITTSLLGVLLGQWLATRLAPKTLKTAAGVCLLFVSLMLMWDVVQF